VRGSEVFGTRFAFTKADIDFYFGANRA